jgi:hypothetical protein
MKKHIYDMSLEERKEYIQITGTKRALEKHLNKLKAQQELRRVK